MRIIRNITLAVFISIISSSCSDSFLDIKPEINRNSVTAFSTSEDIGLGVIGAYEPLTNRVFDGGFVTVTAGHGLFQTNYLFMADARSDNSHPPVNALDDFWNDRWMDFTRFTLNTSNSLLADTYYKCYQGISACNKVLESIVDVEMDEDLKNQYTGEMLFLKSLYYFHLVRNFGAIPVPEGFVATPDEAFEIGAERTPVDEVYIQTIIPDLTKAAEILPAHASYSDANLGRASKGAALGLLAKAEAQRLNWQGVIDATLALDALSEYNLEANYGDIFLGENANKRNGETLFEVQNYGTLPDTQGRYASWSTFYELSVPSQHMESQYFPGDLRLDASIGDVGSPTRRAFIKYPQHEQQPDFGGIYDGDNFIVIRLADIFLLAAEAYTEQGNLTEGLNWLNKVHAHPRTGLTAFAAGDSFLSAPLDQDELRRLIARERHVELAFEGQRWYDLLRYDAAWKGKTTTNNPEDSPLLDFLNAFDESINYEDLTFEYPRDLLYPIPAIEVAVTGIEQNPGTW